jgi:hypothetical protein
MLYEGAAVVSGRHLLFQKCLVINEDLAYSKILDWTNESCLKVTGKSLFKAAGKLVYRRQIKAITVRTT